MRIFLERFLKALERHTKTDVRYVIKGGSVLIIGQVGVSLIGLISSVAFANLLTKDAYGTYQYIITSAEFLATFSLIGLSRAVITSTARGYDGTLDYAFKIGHLWGLGAFVLGVCIGGYYWYNGDIIFALGILGGTICTLLITNAKMYLSFLNAKKLFGLTSSFTVLGLLIPALALISTLLLTQDLLTILSVYFIANALTNIALFVWSRRYKTNDSIDPTVTTQALNLSAQAFIGRLSAYADRILLFLFAGPVVLAEYWIAQNIQRNFSHLFKSAGGIILPKLATRSYATLQTSLPLKIGLLYALIIPFTVAYVLATPYLIEALFPHYLSIVPFTQALGVLFLFLPLQILPDVFVGHGMHDALYRTAVIGSVAKIIATVTLVPLFGMWGILYAIVVEQIVSAILTVKYFSTGHR